MLSASIVYINRCISHSCIFPRLTRSTAEQIKELENKHKEARDEVKTARDEIDRLNAYMVDMVPRAELNAARKVYLYIYICIYIYT